MRNLQEWIFALQSFNLRVPLMSSQHFHVWVALQMSMWVRPSDLASASASSSLLGCQQQFLCPWTSPLTEESCPSNVEISWSMVVLVWFSLCCVQDVCVWMHGFVHWFFTGEGALVGASWWGAAVYLWAVTVLLLVLIGEWQILSFANWSLSWQNYSNS